MPAEVHDRAIPRGRELAEHVQVEFPAALPPHLLASTFVEGRAFAARWLP
jgi:hypothetical protein